MNEIMKSILLLVVDAVKIRVMLEENDDVSAAEVKDIISLEEIRDIFSENGIDFIESCRLAPEAHNAIIAICRVLSFFEQVYDALTEKRGENGYYLRKIADILSPEDFADYFESTGLSKEEAEVFGKRAAIAIGEHINIEEFKEDLAEAYRKRGGQE